MSAAEGLSTEGPRERVLEAALELFSSKGYPDVSIAELCEGAGVNEHEFSEVFDSKFAVLGGLVDSISNAAVAKVLSAMEQAGSTMLEQMYATVGAYVHALLDDPRCALVMGVETLGVSREYSLQRRELRTLFADFIAQAATTYEDHDHIHVGLGQPTHIAVVAAIHELTLCWALDEPEDRVPLDALIVEGVRFMRILADTPRF